ncbi:semaphorin-4A [Thamnophis elegans]|uniref:semaphorin-4A n=1 Tax=Thamnophis elegans TaxID=35005 RepID=UPI0013765D0C|nr:semaphorin-4A [Thamnophis elegans]XP_032090094.1 semaphorin-4A [Thamnophis elegans]
MKPGRLPCLLGCFLMAAAAVGSKVVPRMTFQRGDPGREISAFSQEGILNYDTFLLSADGETLYVGGRDAILALNITSSPISLKGKIPWSPSPSKRRECVFKKKSNETECFNFIRILVQLNETHLYTCGTCAFSPTCAFIDVENFTLVTDAKGEPLLQEGKGLCPFDPRHQNTALIVGGELYTGTMNNFQGNEPVISRTLGSRTILKTDSFLSWLHDDAAFVASFNVPGPPGEEKIYFFFEETAKEFDFMEKLTVSRVARVCKNDVGGDKVLQKKWTTFLKAQLSCSQAGFFPHTVLKHVFALPQPRGGFLFYGIFASQWQNGNSGSSAVCAFSLDAIQKAFDGKYKELNKDCSRWTTYSGPAMDPRPGSCLVGPSSDKALTFMKDHFLMDEKVAPVHDQPLLVKEDVKYTRIAVHQAQKPCGAACTVLFLGTDRGSLHKAVVVGHRAHIIEEIQLFEKPEAVQNLLLVPEKGVLYVGYSEGILEVLVANCSVYATCASCLLARDPYCAWDGRLCRAVWEDTRNRTDWLQDVEQGKAEATCQRQSGKGRAMPKSRNDSDGVPLKVLSGPFNSMVRLSCPPVSALANYSWTYPEGSLPSQEGLTVRDHTGLLVFVHSRTLGEYACWASENGYRHRVAWYDVRSDLPMGGASSANGSPEHQAVPVGEWRSYWVQFVTVTVLLSMTLAVAMALGFFSYHDKLKAKTKVQGCSVPEPSRTPVQEKAPLNGSQSPPGDRNYQSQEATDGTKSCCVQVEGGSRAMDTDNNRLNCPLMNGEEARAVEAI